MTTQSIPAAPLGRTAIHIPVIGLGTAPLAGTAYKAGSPVGQEQAGAVIQYALGQGVRWIDTAPYYGSGLSEQYTGSALAQAPRHTYLLSTKVGRVMTAEGGTTFDFSRDGILRCFEESLRRLHLDAIDILLLHDPDNHYREALDVAFPTLAELRRQGVVRAIGAGMNQWRMLADFARLADLDCLLLAGQYTLLDQDALAEFLPLCQARGIGVLLGGVYSGGVLAVGAVPGAYYKYATASSAILARVQQLSEICATYQVALRDVALQFPLAHPAVTAVVVGAESPGEIAANLRSLQTAIPSELWDALRREGLLPEAAPVPQQPPL